MSTTSKIEWTEATWNPTVGCTHVSPGCDNCYAARLTSGRLRHQPTYAGLAEGGKFNGTVRTLADRLDAPLHWRKPRRVFVNSMSDLFHDSIPDEFIARVFAVMAAAPQHTFQVLTKRHARMRSLLTSADFWYEVGRRARHLGYHYDQAANHLADGRNIYDTAVWERLRCLPNVWLGVSAEDQKRADLRIPHLAATPAAVRFLSCEPLLGPIDLTGLATHSRGPVAHWEGRDQINALTGIPRDPSWTSRPGIDWVIVGGESGKGDGIRPMHPDWARALRDQCRTADVPFFMKQWGEYGPMCKTLPDGRYDLSDPGVTVANDGTVYQPGDLAYPDGPCYGEAIRAGHQRAHLTAMYRVGKKAAGRELDGRTWDQYPGQAPS